MSILIKGMEMPKSCVICPFMTTNDDLSVEDYRYMYCGFPGIGEFVTDYEATRHPDCPLVPVPPHGRLIDADKAYLEGWTLQRYIYGDGSVTIETGRSFFDLPIVIEAEEGE